MDESRRTSGGGNRRSRVDESRRTSGSHRGSALRASGASLKARALPRRGATLAHALGRRRRATARPPRRDAGGEGDAARRRHHARRRLGAAAAVGAARAGGEPAAEAGVGDAGLDKAQHQIKMLMRTVSGIDEDEDEPRRHRGDASMRERRHSRRHEEFERRKERRMRASGRALWWMLAARGSSPPLPAGGLCLRRARSAANYACNVATLVVTLLGLIAVRRAFRHNYSVTVLKRLWSKLPILLALLSTLAVVCVEAYLLAVAGCSFAAAEVVELPHVVGALPSAGAALRRRARVDRRHRRVAPSTARAASLLMRAPRSIAATSALTPRCRR